MSSHSRLSPSALAAALLCPGKPNAEAGLPDSTSEYAAEGTVFHDVAAYCLQFGLEPWVFVGTTHHADGYTFEFTAEMAEHMQGGLDRIAELLSSPGVRLYVEKRVSLEPWLGPGEGGTTDVLIIDVVRREMTVFDWKYGAGKAVHPEWNPQAIGYALGAWSTVARAAIRPTAGVKVRIIIYQPRLDGGGGEWETTMDALLAYADETLVPGALRTHDPDAPRIPGEDQCQFCKAKGTCRELARKNLEWAQLQFRDLDEYAPALPVPGDLTPLERSYIHMNSDLFKSWLDAVSERIRLDALHGRPTPELKLVPGRRGKRIWTDEKAVEKKLVRALGEDAYTKKLLGPAGAEKLLPKAVWDELEDFRTQSTGKPTIVPESDARKALTPHAMTFTDLDATEANED